MQQPVVVQPGDFLFRQTDSPPKYSRFADSVKGELVGNVNARLDHFRFPILRLQYR